MIDRGPIPTAGMGTDPLTGDYSHWYTHPKTGERVWMRDPVPGIHAYRHGNTDGMDIGLQVAAALKYWEGEK